MSDEKPYDAGNPDDVKTARRGERRSQLLRKDMVAAIMSLPQGREWIWDLLVFSGINGSPLTDKSELTHFNIGMQNVGRYILNDITSITPDLYIQMLKEKTDARTSHTSRNAASGNASADSSGDSASASGPAGSYTTDN